MRNRRLRAGRGPRPGLLLACAALAALCAIASADDLSDGAWADYRQKALRLMKIPGQRFTKLQVVEVLGRDDSRRAAELFVDWSLRSLKLQEGPLRKALEEAQRDFERVEKMMRRSYDSVPPLTWRTASDRDTWSGARTKVAEARALYEVEGIVRFALAEELQRIRDPKAVKYLASEGLPAVLRLRGADSVQVAIARGLLQQPPARVLRTALVLARDAAHPKLRILALNWFGRHRIAHGYALLIGALAAPETVVRRTAVLGLRALDDPRCVGPLIKAMQGADGQLNAEIDEVLFHFTGQSFEGSADVWKQWWQDAGTAWRAQGAKERFERPRTTLPGGTRARFYGIPTESHHVVFVLDRSGSMNEKAGDLSQPRPTPKPRPPTTGPGSNGGGKKKGDEPIRGERKIDVAKNQLARSIQQLAKEVRFNVVFYSHDVRVWKEPPQLLEGTPANKQAAAKWFMALQAGGPTLLLPALRKALEYADTFRPGVRTRPGADTIFLLSDGSPTDADGKSLEGEALERQYRAFLEANELYHCVVHTIGIGPDHNRSFLERIARDTGGRYKAVGVK